MSTLDYTTVNLGLPAVPETNDPKLFQELVRIYNAIKILAQGVDSYTSDGTVTDSVSNLADRLESLVDSSAELAELKKQYYRYTVPRLKVIGNFACNGKLPATPPTIADIAVTAPASGAGTLAGAFDTAATRDAVISAINANAVAVAELQTILKSIGLAK